MSVVTEVGTRREVHYSNLNDVILDSEALAGGEVQTVGNWSFGQILEHLAVSFDCSIDGFGFKAPWVARNLVAPFLKNSFLTKPMSSGYKLPASAEALQPGNVSVEEGLEHLKRAITRYESEIPNADHPFLGKLARQEWISLGLRHSELHLSFVKPAD